MPNLESRRLNGRLGKQGCFAVGWFLLFSRNRSRVNVNLTELTGAEACWEQAGQGEEPALLTFLGETRNFIVCAKTLRM